MQKELEMWKAENDRHAEAIRKEERCVTNVVIKDILLTLATKHRRRVTAIVWRFSVCPSVCMLVCPPEALGMVNNCACVNVC